MEHFVEIILAVISLVSSGGFIVSSSQLRKSKAQAEKEELDLSQSYIEMFKANIYEPLEKELQRLRRSIEKVNVCPYRNQCPVSRELFNARQDGAPDCDNC